MEHRRGVIVTFAVAAVLALSETEPTIGWQGVTISADLVWWLLLAAHVYTSAMWLWVSGDVEGEGSFVGTLHTLWSGLWLSKQNTYRAMRHRAKMMMKSGLPTWAALLGLGIILYQLVFGGAAEVVSGSPRGWP